MGGTWPKKELITLGKDPDCSPDTKYPNFSEAFPDGNLHSMTTF